MDKPIGANSPDFSRKNRGNEGEGRTARRLSNPAITATMKVLQCPQCGSTDIYYEAGMITGQKYHCNKCNYVGSFVIEREMPEP
jgi:predicted RNA-binding Zn-ribbon protein involved in translation (DUF1610 family)